MERLVVRIDMGRHSGPNANRGPIHRHRIYRHLYCGPALGTTTSQDGVNVRRLDPVPIGSLADSHTRNSHCHSTTRC